MSGAFRLCLVATLAFARPCLADTGSNSVIRTVAGLNDAVIRQALTPGMRFDVTGTVILCAEVDTLWIADETGVKSLNRPVDFTPLAGDLVRMAGVATANEIRPYIWRTLDAKIIGKGVLPEPVTTTVGELLDGRHDNRLVRTEGTVIDVREDEIDRNALNIILRDDDRTIVAGVPSHGFPSNSSARLIGARISLVGLCKADFGFRRRFFTRGLSSNAKDITIVEPASGSPFDAPELPTSMVMDSSTLLKLGRIRVDGTVLVAWNSNHLMLKTPKGDVISASLSSSQDGPPKPGDFIRLVGLPESDLFNLNLSSAIWRRQDGTAETEGEPRAISATQLCPNDTRRKFDSNFHGKLVRLTGGIQHLPRPGDASALQIESDDRTVSVNVSACPEVLNGITAGSRIEVIGICRMEIENWRPTAPLPTINGYSIIIRSPADIRVVAHPSWWTATRLVYVIAVLLLTLLVCIVWNRMLKRIIARRSRELAKEELAAAEADMRLGERTALAVELHDTLSQTLTGAAMEISAAVKSGRGAPREMLVHLDTAEKTLQSCRDDLRNCLWDLRSQALECPDMTAAILKTLEPHISDSRLSVRFNVPRDLLTENLTHAILCSVRELVLNAIRHGRADSVKVAGCLENGDILFSVTDNGCGFDPDACPGVLQGHFGLQGIRERLRKLHGTFRIDSRPRGGTKATATLKIRSGQET